MIHSQIPQTCTASYAAMCETCWQSFRLWYPKNLPLHVLCRCRFICICNPHSKQSQSKTPDGICVIRHRQKVPACHPSSAKSARSSSSFLLARIVLIICFVDPLIASETFAVLRIPNPLPMYNEPGCVNEVTFSSLLFLVLTTPLVAALCTASTSFGDEESTVISGSFDEF